MKTIINLLVIFMTSSLFAKEYTKAEEEALIQKFLKTKERTKSAKKVNQKLDEILDVLQKDKKNKRGYKK